MILDGPLPAGPRGLWLLEGVPCVGKSTLLHRWRRETEAPVLWAGEDLATQRLFEPLETAHRPEAVEPWLRGLLQGWQALQARASAMAWAGSQGGFLAIQERFHLSAEGEGGLGPGAFEALEAALAEAGAQGVLLTLSGPELGRRLEASLTGRPPAWGRWLEGRYGSLAGATAAFLQRQSELEGLAHRSLLPWRRAQT